MISVTEVTANAPKLAICGGKPAVTIKAPAWPFAGEQEIKWMEEVLRSGAWSWVGQHERAFCQEFAQFIGTRYCLCLANGTVTLQCALQAVGVEPGDEVIVPGMTWCATAQAAMDIGANVVFVDVDPMTLCIDPKAAEAAITPRTKAIIPVHLYGCMCDMDAIMALARTHKLKVVEDVAHQHGSQWRGVSAGAIGDVGSFSFQQSKILTCGEGGAVTCNDPDVYSTIFALKQVGWTPGDPQAKPFDDLVPGNRYGHNYRMTEMQAVLLRGGLSRLPEQNRQREQAAGYIARRLREMGGPLQAVERDPRVTRQAYYGLTLYYDSAQARGLAKEGYAAALKAEGCRFMGPYWPVYRAPLLNLYDKTSPIPYRDAKTMQNYRDLRLPNVERCVYETGVILGQGDLLGSVEYLDQVLAAVGKVNDNLPQAKAAYEQSLAK